VIYQIYDNSLVVGYINAAKKSTPFLMALRRSIGARSPNKAPKLEPNCAGEGAELVGNQSKIVVVDLSS